MKILSLVFCIVIFTVSCGTTAVTQEQVQAATTTLDFGDFRSTTLATKSWEALDQKNYPAVIAYSQKCVELYGEQGKTMNAGLTVFPPVEKVNEYWALNDAGTCQFILATTYETLKMYPQAAQAFRTLTDDFSFTQCWDPKGWYWHPASVAGGKAEKYESKLGL